MNCSECIYYPDNCKYEKLDGVFLIPSYKGNKCLICKNYESKENA